MSRKEVTKFSEKDKDNMSQYQATKQHVLNRGVAPDAFLDELVAWGKSAPDEIFAPNTTSDIYSSVKNTLGPWTGLLHRRAVMLEVMRVLGGFESSWDWSAGRDTTNSTSVTPNTTEAGLWQVSANAMNFGAELKALVQSRIGTLDGEAFQAAMKQDHTLAMEFIARLLRRTTAHNGPILRHEIDPWLRRDAVNEFLELIADAEHGFDPDIEALDLAPVAKAAAYALRDLHPEVVFTSGRRDKVSQARAMASNIISNRNWVAQTYADTPARAACQRWIDDHPEAATQHAIQQGLLQVFDSLSADQLGRLSKHLSGEAFDIQPMANGSKAKAVKVSIKALSGLQKFLEKEGGLIRWHAQF